MFDIDHLTFLNVATYLPLGFVFKTFKFSSRDYTELKKKNN